jgi:hypothetical protein
MPVALVGIMSVFSEIRLESNIQPGFSALFGLRRSLFPAINYK